LWSRVASRAADDDVGVRTRRYGVTMNNAILAEEKHVPLYDEMVAKYPVEYTAGGATQNSIRVAQWISGHPGMTTMLGCIGVDKYGAELEAAARADGVTTMYLKDPAVPTGTCAVLIHEAERSLVANLGAANHYKLAHLESDEVQAMVRKARVLYTSGFFLTVSPDSMVTVGKHAAEAGKTFMLNLSAPFLSQFFSEPMHRVMPFADFVFGNESEAKAYGDNHGMVGASVEEVALKIASLPKASGSLPRTVVITQGSHPVVVARERVITHYPSAPIPPSEIVDFNGAGDAFVGGFIAQLIDGHSIAECVKCGQWAARKIIGRSGCTLPAGPANYVA
jgi:adenosine kinase